MNARPISRSDVVRLLKYDPNTGIFRWRIGRKRVRKGSIAGNRHGKGYWRITVNGQEIPAHRLAWIYCYGYIPFDTDIDHRDGDNANNKLSNLRPCMYSSSNHENTHWARIDNSTGKLGVSPASHSKKFRARIQVMGERKVIGYFEDTDKAHQAYVEEKRKVHSYCTI